MNEAMIEWERVPNKAPGYYELTATLGVVDPAYVKTMQERIRENQIGFAVALAGRVIAEIEWFGQNERITKSVAKRIIMNVLRDMQKTD